MCGIAGYLRKGVGSDPRPVGTVALEMLRALSVRGPDSSGIAMYEPPVAGHQRVRVKLSDGAPGPDLLTAVVRAASSLTTVSAVHAEGECAQFQIGTGVDIAALEGAILTAVPTAEVFGVGACLELMKQVGHPDQLDRQFHVAERNGTHAIGHTRLSTESKVDISHSQPFWAHGVEDLAVVHNGHVTNYHKLRKQLEHRGFHFYTENDSEIIGPYLLDQMRTGCTLQEALTRSTRDLDGSYSYLVASAEGIGVVKDFFCSKPLVCSETDDYVALATEEIAIRAALPDAPPPVELGASAVRFWKNS